MTIAGSTGVMSKSPFFDQMKKLQSNKQEQYKLDDETIEAVTKAHRTLYGYGPEIEAMMAQLGYKNPPYTGESVMEYLTRLLKLAQPGGKPVDWQSATTYMYNSNTSELDWFKQSQKEQQNWQYEQEKWQYQKKLQQWQEQQYITQTNQPVQVPFVPLPQLQPYNLQPYLQGQTVPELTTVEPEKPKRDLPDPIEPKKRLMKKL
jgi:hypothetical protein